MNVENQFDNNQFDQLLLECVLNNQELFNEQNTSIMATHVFTSNTEFSPIENQSVLESLERNFTPQKNKWRLNFILLLSTIALVTAGVI